MAVSNLGFVGTAHTISNQTRIFRAQGEIPLEWTDKIFDEKLRERFPGNQIQVHAFYKHPIVKEVTTALVGISKPIPEELLPLEKSNERSVTLDIYGCEIEFDHCLGLTTLFEPREGVTPKAECVSYYPCALLS
jgi:hypothetical protein